MIRLGRKGMLFVLLTLTAPSFAAVVKDLYEVRVPVAGKSQDERQSSLQRAFEELLIRVTGDRNIAATDAGRRMIGNTDQYIRQYRYEVDNQPRYGRPSIALGGVAEPIPNQRPTQILWAQFDDGMVRDALIKAKLPVWGATRPSVLVWIAIQDYDQRFLVDRNQLSDAADAIKAVSRQTGMPVVLPFADATDQKRINLTDIWGDFPDQILDASARYDTEVILTGRVSVDTFGVWQSRWTIYHDGKTLTWRTEQRDLASSIREGFWGAASQLATRYASKRSDDGKIEYKLEIQNIANLDDYVRAGKYLASLAAVARYHIVELKEGYVLFDIELSGDRANLEQAIGLGNTLRRARTVNTEGENVLVYQLAQ